jgi:two-component system LytT family response regulator
MEVDTNHCIELTALLRPSDTIEKDLEPSGSKDIFVAVDEIEWIEANSYFSCLHVGSKRYMFRETVKQLAATLDPNTFIRVHRCTIVNINYVHEILREGQN